MVAIENKERTSALYKKIYFLNTWIVSYCCAMLFLLVNQFVVIWIGEAYLLSYDVIFFICLNLYMRLVRCPNSTFIDTYGLFWNVKWKAIAEALINVVASLFLLIVMDMGVSGVLLGTFISNIVTNFWFEPYILYRSRFKQPVVHYFKHFLIYFCCILCGTMISYGVNYSILITSNELRFVVCAIIDSFLINAIFVALFRKTEEYKYAKGICNKVLKKIVRNKMS